MPVPRRHILVIRTRAHAVSVVDVSAILQAIARQDERSGRRLAVAEARTSILSVSTKPSKFSIAQGTARSTRAASLACQPVSLSSRVAKRRKKLRLRSEPFLTRRSLAKVVTRFSFQRFSQELLTRSSASLVLLIPSNLKFG